MSLDAAKHPQDGIETLLHDLDVFVLPGWNGSGPFHWQTLWQRQYPGWHRVEQEDWARPEPSEWIDAISRCVRSARRPIVLIAHSLACIAVSRWADADPRLADSIEGALLVAPADVEDPRRCPVILRKFGPIARARLPFRSVLIGSENDPYMSLAKSSDLASGWGSSFINAGRVGHINCDSGHGAWPQGESYFADLIR